MSRKKKQQQQGQSAERESVRNQGDGKENGAKANHISPEQFIMDWPLYVKARIEEFDPPGKISYRCRKCEKETTWDRSYPARTLVQGVADPQILSVEYHCHFCNSDRLTTIYRGMEYEERVIAFVGLEPPTGMPPPPPSTKSVLVGVMKIGQYPGFSINLAVDLEKALGKTDAALYKKALISRNYGYGLAAVMYIRRVVEDKTNELIDVAAQLAESNGFNAETVSSIRAASDAKNYTKYEDKLQVASTVFPDRLKVEGINPLHTLYALVSEGIHGRSEEECVDIADRTKDVFEYLFTNLRAQVIERKMFAEKVKGLNKRKS